MSTLRVSNIEAKADPSSPTVNEQVKITNSNGDVLLYVDGRTSGITTVGINTTAEVFKVDSYKNFEYSGIITAASFSGPIDASTGTFSSDVTISGNLGVAGTITYEDVARVDATGISTFREGFGVGPLAGIALTAYKDGSIRTSGIITASSFSGTVASSNLSGALPALDGSALTGVGASFGNSSVNTSGIITATAFVPTSQSLSHRNLIINGSSIVAQRGTSSTNTSYATVDRVKPYWASHNAGTITQSQQDVASGNDCYNAGFRKSYRVAISQAGNTNSAACYISVWKQRIEARNIACSGWRHWDPNSKLTLSFWIKSTTADTFALQFYVDDNTKKKYNTPVPATTSWTKITKTIPGHADININNDNGRGLAVTLAAATGSDLAGSVTQNTWVPNTTAAVAANNISTWLTAGAGNVETTGWQLEVGPVATPFEHRSYGEELARCQRYYYTLNNDTSTYYWFFPINNGNYRRCCITYPVTMRAAPTITNATGTNNSSAGTPTGTQHVDIDHTEFHWDVSNAAHLVALNTADFSSEL